MANGKVTSAGAITTFAIVGGLAGGLANILLTKRLGKSSVKTSSVVIAALVSAVFTFGAAFLIEKVAEQGEELETLSDGKVCLTL